MSIDGWLLSKADKIWNGFGNGTSIKVLAKSARDQALKYVFCKHWPAYFVQQSENGSSLRVELMSSLLLTKLWDLPQTNQYD